MRAQTKTGVSVKRLLLAGVAALTTGCAVAPPPTAPSVYPIHAPFDEREARTMLERGTNTIKGNGFARQRGGGVVTCAGSTVFLVPATGYARERFRNMYGNEEGGPLRISGSYRFEPDPPQYRQLTRVTKCDAQGDFQFDQVADGDFYVVTGVVWQVGYSPQGGQVMQRVSVKDGQIATAVLAL